MMCEYKDALLVHPYSSHYNTGNSARQEQEPWPQPLRNAGHFKNFPQQGIVFSTLPADR